MMNQIPTPERLRPAPTGRVLIVNMGRLGDTILRNSILDSAFRTFAQVDYLCGQYNAELLRHDPRLNRVMVFQNSFAGFASLMQAMFGGRYDAIIDLKGHASSTSLILAALLPGRVKTGCNRGWLRPFDRDVSSLIVPALPVIEAMRRIGRAAGLVEGEFKPKLSQPKDSIEWFGKNHAGLPRPFIFLNISATTSIRMWSVENWARYVHGCGLTSRTILINGAPQDRELVRQLCSKLPGTTAFQPRNFMDVVAAIDASQLVLTVDTGVVHACSALDKPIVALSSVGDTPAAYLPLSTWQLLIHPRTGCNVADINPDEAIEATKSCDLTALFDAAAVPA